MAAGDRPSTDPKKEKAESVSQHEQSERFKETARKLSVDETGEAFEKAVRAILKPKPR